MNEHVLYLGRMVPEKAFRVYIYSVNGEKKLVNSWAEFESEISSGKWFDTMPKADEKGLKKKGKR